MRGGLCATPPRAISAPAGAGAANSNREQRAEENAGQSACGGRRPAGAAVGQRTGEPVGHGFQNGRTLIKANRRAVALGPACGLPVSSQSHQLYIWKHRIVHSTTGTPNRYGRPLFVVFLVRSVYLVVHVAKLLRNRLLAVYN